MAKPDIEGRGVEKVRRMLYVFPDGRDKADEGGPIEFRLDDGRVFWLDVGADGASLKITWEAWSDPFAEPLTEENRRWVEEAGKWTAFDVGAEPPYSGLVGETIQYVTFARRPTARSRGSRCIPKPRRGLRRRGRRTVRRPS